MSDNVIQFPGKGARPQPESKPEGQPSPQPQNSPKKGRAKSKAKKNSKGLFAIAVIAVTCFAANYAVLETSQVQQISMSSSTSGRAIASVGGDLKRDAAWEKNLAERLADPVNRDIAAIQGRSASLEEQLRWGTLEEKYTITYQSDAREIASVILQDTTLRPSYVLNRKEFLSDYGRLLKSGFATARLKSVEASGQNTVEAYTLLDEKDQPQGEVRFELDRHQRLLSLKVDHQEM